MYLRSGQIRGFTSGVTARLGRTHYETLKVSQDASSAEIKNRFKKISLKLHPDMLKSQGLSEDELKSRSEEYLMVKKSYEVLADEQTREAYDLHIGLRTRNSGTGKNPNIHSHFRRPGNTFHFHEKYSQNDVPHFDKHKYNKINEKLEKRYNYNQKINQHIDTFGRDLYARNLGKDGPRKGIYKDYGYQPNIRDDEGEGKRIAMKLAGGVIGLFTLWYIFLGNYTTTNPKGNPDPKKNIVELDAKKGVQSELEKSEGELPTKGKTMTVNNNYGLMLIKKDIETRIEDSDIMREFEEQVAESAE